MRSLLLPQALFHTESVTKVKGRGQETSPHLPPALEALPALWLAVMLAFTESQALKLPLCFPVTCSVSSLMFEFLIVVIRLSLSEHRMEPRVEPHFPFSGQTHSHT